MLFVLITNVIGSFQAFDTIFVMTEGGPGNSTEVATYLIYDEAFRKFDFGYAVDDLGPAVRGDPGGQTWPSSPTSSVARRTTSPEEVTMSDHRSRQPRSLRRPGGRLPVRGLPVPDLTVLTAFKGPGQLFATPAVGARAGHRARPRSTGCSRPASAATCSTPSLVTVGIIVGQLVFARLAAYAFARLSFPGRDALFWVYLSTLMVPPVVTMIPLYLMMQRLGLVDTWAGLMLPTMLGTPYAIFLLRQFFRTIPADLEDAARIDGAGRVRTLLSIVLPLSKPILVTVTTLAVVANWNSFLWPLIITSSEDKRLLSVGIALFKGEVGVDYNAVMAGSLIALAAAAGAVHLLPALHRPLGRGHRAQVIRRHHVHSSVPTDCVARCALVCSAA